MLPTALFRFERAGRAAFDIRGHHGTQTGVRCFRVLNGPGVLFVEDVVEYRRTACGSKNFAALDGVEGPVFSGWPPVVTALLVLRAKKMPPLEQVTRPATIAIDRSGLAVVRFQPMVKLNIATIAEVMQARSGAGPGSCMVIAMIPENTDHDMDLLAVDHFTANGLAYRTTALAIVCEELGLVPLLRLYFARHPAPFNVSFCANLEEAKHWMRKQVGSLAVV